MADRYARPQPIKKLRALCIHLEFHFRPRQGITRIIESTEAVGDSMINMVSFLETGKNPYILDKDNHKMQRSLGYVVGFEIEILKMIGRFKLSQNKNATDKQLAKEHLISASKKGHALRNELKKGNEEARKTIEDL